MRALLHKVGVSIPNMGGPSVLGAWIMNFEEPQQLFVEQP